MIRILGDTAPGLGNTGNIFVYLLALIYDNTLNGEIAVVCKHGIRNVVQRLGVGALALALTLGVFAPVTARAAGDIEADAIIAYPAMSQDKPKVVIQGNGVIDKSGKATGFYELALCVQTTFVYYAKTDGSGADHDRGAVEWSVYQEELENAAKADEADGGMANVEAVKAQYVIVERPFKSASATVTVNVEALTAVSWDEAYPEYYKWDNGTQSYKDDSGNVLPKGYPYGVSSALKKNYDWTKVNQSNRNTYLRLDTARPDEVTYASAAVEYYDATNQTVLIALTAGTDYQAPVNYTEPTPVAVIRFAYDKERFSQSVDKEVSKDGTTKTYQDFWVGVNKVDRLMTDGSVSGGTPRTALTYLVEDVASAADTDERVSNPRAGVGQFVLAEVGTSPENTDYTRFYYYLGGDGIGTTDFPSTSSEQKWVIRHNDEEPTEASVEKLSTVGETVLTWSEDSAGGYTYSYEPNLLTTKNGGFAMTYVNQETYRPATGGKGGVQILFYDWDDTLIGSLIVDETGDARADVEEYVEKNMVHPDLRTTATQYANHTSAAYANLCDSIERQHTYRGKFSYMYGQDDDDSLKRGSDSEYPGEHYPLTNKLDYVFYKRINGVTHVTSTDDTGKTTETDYYTTNTLSQFEDGREYPYTYGWAIVAVENFGETFDPSDSGYTRQDAAKIEDTWTTIDVGEFENYDPTPSTDPDKPDNPVPSTGGGITADTVKYPSWVDVSTGLTPNGTKLNELYQFETSAENDNAYLEFADFSDMEALVNHGGNKRDTVIVKAVYENGEKLGTSSEYIFASGPDYNKLNDTVSSNGGVYSVNLTYERYNYDLSGAVIGVFRIRDPYIRQHFTTDLHWEETEDEEGNRQTLTNASQDEADNDRTKTTYIRVESSNVDVIEVQLALSARHNKVDVYLTDGYKSNFIAGAERSLANITRKKTSQYIIDNYNYLVDGESDETDDYLDVSFENKDGSYGFVLLGTINRMLEKAKYADEEELAFQKASTNALLNDINIRKDADGNTIAYKDLSTIRPKILAAAAEAKAKHEENSALYDSDYWNTTRDCAALSYHQLQWYILEGKLLSRAEAEDEHHKLSWCHLHVSCAALVSNAPESWAELVEAALNHPEYIDELSLNQATELAGLRKDANGTAFASLDEFKTAFVDAVKAAGSDTGWMNIQKLIIEQNLQKTDPAATYDGDPYEDFWWAIASSKPSAPGSFGELVEALKTWDTEKKLPDDTKVKGFTAQLAPLRDLVAANAKKTGEETDSKYVKATANLVANITEAGKPERFTSYDDSADGARDGFLTRVLQAYTDTKNQNGTVDIDGDGDKDTDDYWYVLQRAIIAQSVTTESSQPNADLVERYYWKDGVTKIEDFKSMVTAPEKNPSAWESFSFSDYQKIPSKETGFRLNFDGTGKIETEADFKKLKDAITAFAVPGNCPVGQLSDIKWVDIQYFLLHNTDFSSGTYVYNSSQKDKESQAGYYWWEEDGEGTAHYFRGINLNNYLTAAFKSAINKNVHAWDGLTAAKMKSDFADFKFAKVTGGYDGVKDVPNSASLSRYEEADLEAVKQALEALVIEVMKTATEPHTLPDAGLNWYQVQHWLITGTYQPTYGTGEDLTAEQKKMWWWNDGSNPEAKGKNGFQILMTGSDPNVDDLVNPPIRNIASMTNEEIYALSTGDICFITNTYVPATTTSHATNMRNNVPKWLKLVDAAGDSLNTLTWYQVQYGIIKRGTNTSYVDDVTARNFIMDLITTNKKNTGDWRPAWLKEADPITSEATISLFSLDSTEQLIASQLDSLDEEQKQQVLEYILNLLSGAKLSQSVQTDASGSGSTSAGTTARPSQPTHDEESDSVEDNWFENIFRIEEETAETPMLEYSTARRQASPGTITVVSPMGAYLNPFSRRAAK